MFGLLEDIVDSAVDLVVDTASSSVNVVGSLASGELPTGDDVHVLLNAGYTYAQISSMSGLSVAAILLLNG